jgi:threonyl-tRNA synthetase
MQKVPYMLVIGDREIEEGQLAVRMRSGDDLGAISVESFKERILGEVRRHE